MSASDLTLRKLYPNTMSKSKSVNALAGRLSTLLVEVLNHPKTEVILADAALEAYHDSGCEARHAGDLVRMLALLGRHVCDAAEGDMEEMSDHYTGEAERADHGDDCDHSPDDCEQYANEYAAARKVYAKAGQAMTRITGDICVGLKRAGI
jgi:hypothetical protein